MLVGTQPPDLAQIKDWEMKKVLHFTFPDEELEPVEWRFIFCERFPGWRALGPHHEGVQGVGKRF